MRSAIPSHPCCVRASDGVAVIEPIEAQMLPGLNVTQLNVKEALAAAAAAGGLATVTGTCTVPGPRPSPHPASAACMLPGKPGAGGAVAGILAAQRAGTAYLGRAALAAGTARAAAGTLLPEGAAVGAAALAARGATADQMREHGGSVQPACAGEWLVGFATCVGPQSSCGLHELGPAPGGPSTTGPCSVPQCVTWAAVRQRKACRHFAP
jgi:hypothetical protein